MNFLKKRFGLICFGALSILEGFGNTLIYLLFLERLVNPIDISIPFYFNYFKVNYEQD